LRRDLKSPRVVYWNSFSLSAVLDSRDVLDSGDDFDERDEAGSDVVLLAVEEDVLSSSLPMTVLSREVRKSA
jgi:hypothetical protein